MKGEHFAKIWVTTTPQQIWSNIINSEEFQDKFNNRLDDWIFIVKRIPTEREALVIFETMEKNLCREGINAQKGFHLTRDGYVEYEDTT